MGLNKGPPGIGAEMKKKGDIFERLGPESPVT